MTYLTHQEWHSITLSAAPKARDSIAMAVRPWFVSLKMKSRPVGPTFIRFELMPHLRRSTIQVSRHPRPHGRGYLMTVLWTSYVALLRRVLFDRAESSMSLPLKRSTDQSFRHLTNRRTAALTALRVCLVNEAHQHSLPALPIVV